MRLSVRQSESSHPAAEPIFVVDPDEYKIAMGNMADMSKPGGSGAGRAAGEVAVIDVDDVDDSVDADNIGGGRADDARRDREMKRHKPEGEVRTKPQSTSTGNVVRVLQRVRMGKRNSYWIVSTDFVE